MAAQRGWRTYLKIGLAGITVGGCTFALKHNDWEISSIGAVRFGRAAYAIHLRSAVRLRQMCCTNGGAFIKIGQHLGSLDYLIPREYVETMKVLHDKAPESKLEDLYKVIEEDLGKKVDELFTNFDPIPLGAASLAQVHKATLKDGRVVAVKVQHPKVKAHSFVDLKTMEFLVHSIAWMFPGFEYVWLAEESKKNLPIELDFLNEGKNCERVSKIFKNFEFLKVPKIYWDLSSERVLTMEFCEGGKVDDRAYMQKHGISVNEVTKNLGKLYSEMIFVQGYIHCDPHPGNVFVNKTSRGTEIILLDHGLYQTLTDDFRVNYSKLWMALINTDIEGMKTYADAMNCGHLYGLFACMLTGRSWKAVSSGIDKHDLSEAEDDEIKSNAATYLFEISDILNRIPRQMLLILKTNDVLRGIESSLKTRANATSFINMSRCCVRALAQDRLQFCENWVCRFKVWTSKQWQLTKISMYEFYLWFASSPIGLLMFKKKALYSS